jgi:hypothetical protein
MRAPHLEKRTGVRSETQSPGFAAYLLDDGPDIREALFVICTGPSISADHAVKFCMGPGLNLWV